jgi:hypothetical protein
MVNKRNQEGWIKFSRKTIHFEQGRNRAHPRTEIFGQEKHK